MNPSRTQRISLTSLVALYHHGVPESTRGFSPDCVPSCYPQLPTASGQEMRLTKLPAKNIFGFKKTHSRMTVFRDLNFDSQEISERCEFYLLPEMFIMYLALYWGFVQLSKGKKKPTHFFSSSPLFSLNHLPCVDTSGVPQCHSLSQINQTIYKNISYKNIYDSQLNSHRCWLEPDNLRWL